MLKIENNLLALTRSDVIGIASGEEFLVLDANDAFLKMTGYSRADMLDGKINWYAMTPPEMQARSTLAMQEGIQSGRFDPFEKDFFRKDGSRITVIVGGSCLSADPFRYICFFLDISAHKRTQQALSDSEERYRTLYDNNPSMYFTVCRQGIILSVNRFGAQQLGYEAEELVGLSIFDLAYAEDKDIARANFKSYLTEVAGVTESEFRKVRKDGQIVWARELARSVQDSDGNTVILIVCEEITERKKVEAQLLHGAYHDTLTGLPNQALFGDLLKQVIAKAKCRDNYLFAVLFLDLDRFKVINDSLGHLIGDQLLVATAQRLKLTLRSGDMVARFGGDEFTILLDDLHHIDEATEIAESIHQALRQPLQLDGNEVYTTASIGIALNTRELDTPEDILRDADIAMYRAKALGKARHEIFDRDMHNYALRLWRLEADLRRAIVHEELLIHYQPILGTHDGQVKGVEALIRWQHPHRGLIYPEEFISLAEETGLITVIGERLMRKACTQLKKWQISGHPQLHIAVNFSALQFQNQHLGKVIKAVLHDTGVDPSTFKLEITESLAMKNIEFSIATLHELNDMGVRISIDDFGTGYSSLAYLKQFPLSTIKIDSSFVRDMGHNPDDAAITAAIIAMAHGLKLNVVAEGVETEQQRALLDALRCDDVQGFLFSKPLTADGFTKFLKDENVQSGNTGKRSREAMQRKPGSH